LTTQARAELFNDLGIEVPSIALQVDATLEQDRFRIDLEGVPVTGGTVPPEGLLVDDDPVHLDLLKIPYRAHAQQYLRAGHVLSGTGA